MLYDVANGSGSPFNRATKRNVLPIEIKKPKVMNITHPDNRCWNVIDGK